MVEELKQQKQIRHFDLAMGEGTTATDIYHVLRDAGFQVEQVEETTKQISQRINGLFVRNWLKVHEEFEIPYSVAKTIADEFPVVSGRRLSAYTDGFMKEYANWMKMRSQQLQGKEVSVS